MHQMQHMLKKYYNITGMGRLLLHGWNDQISSTVFQDDFDRFLGLADKIKLRGLPGQANQEEENQEENTKFISESYKNVIIEST